MDWFSADWHLGHDNIRKYSNRPYHDVEEMNWDIIRNMRELCAPGDRLWILGDLSFVPPHNTAEYLQYLAGIDLFLILGNHDREPSRLTRGLFKWWGHYRRIDIEGQKICLSHYPMESWHGSHHGSWMLHGHCHGKLERLMPRRLDVGVDCWDMKPVSFEQLQAHPNMGGV